MPACCSLDRIYNTNGPNKHSQQALMVTIRISTLKKNLIIMRKLCNYSLSQLQFWHVWMNPPSAALTGVCSHCHPSWIPVKKTGYATARAQSCPGVGKKKRSTQEPALREPTEIDQGQKKRSWFKWVKWFSVERKTHEERLCYRSNQSHSLRSLHALQVQMRPLIVYTFARFLKTATLIHAGTDLFRFLHLEGTCGTAIWGDFTRCLCWVA